MQLLHFSLHYALGMRVNVTMTWSKKTWFIDAFML